MDIVPVCPLYSDRTYTWCTTEHASIHTTSTVTHVLKISLSYTHTQSAVGNMCVLLQGEFSGQQKLLTCLILSVMLFLHWQGNTLSVSLTLSERAEKSVWPFLPLSLLLDKSMCTSKMTFIRVYFIPHVSLVIWLNRLHYHCCLIIA